MNHHVALLAGIGAGFSLIIAIGSQNAFVLRQGLTRSYVGPVVAICAISDVVLILIGVSGMSALITASPSAARVLRVVGGLFLLAYAMFAARRALNASALEVRTSEKKRSLAATGLTALAFTWLNPHVYLDTVVLLGSLSSRYSERRGWFAAGASLASLIWFSTLGFGARFAAPLLTSPRSWRILDGSIAIIMTTLGTSLLINA